MRGASGVNPGVNPGVNLGVNPGVNPAKAHPPGNRASSPQS